MRTRIEQMGWKAVPLDTARATIDLAEWMLAQTKQEPAILLAHAVDGVIWGKVENGSLLHSGKIFPSVSPLLRPETLLEARLFNQTDQVYIWRTGQGFNACSISDAEKTDGFAFDERHILWGTTALERKDGFTLLTDGSEGLRHAVPMDVPNSRFGAETPRPVILQVRHYVDYDDTGQAFIAAQRLVALTTITK